MSDAIYEIFDGSTLENNVFSSGEHSTITIQNQNYNKVACFLVNGGYSIQSNNYGGNSGDAAFYQTDISTDGISTFTADVTIGVGAIYSRVTLHIGETEVTFYTTENQFSTNNGGEAPNVADDNQYYSNVLYNIPQENARYLNLTEPVGQGWGGDEGFPGKGYGAGYSIPTRGGGGGGYIPLDLQFVSRLTSPTGFSRLDSLTQLAPTITATGYTYTSGYILLHFYRRFIQAVQNDVRRQNNVEARRIAKREAMRLTKLEERRSLRKEAKRLQNIEARRLKIREARRLAKK